MPHLNVEIKANCANLNSIREILLKEKAHFKGIDHQIDTYFVVLSGRLKLREGNIENALIQYDRIAKKGPKNSSVRLYHSSDAKNLKDILTAALGVKVVVDKQREIYFINNVKFHLDKVKELGTFVEIEAIESDKIKSEQALKKQCDHFIQLLKIKEEDLIRDSYSDLLGNLL
ncbi:MAG: class IV adenylate cyclase [Bacteroidetes bacterium]|nr:class IV adenylate cyclase [Bacteroidota bacterium]